VARLLQQLELRVVEQRTVIAIATGVTLHQHGRIVKSHPAADVEAVVVAIVDQLVRLDLALADVHSTLPLSSVWRRPWW